jgi:hypothetical protein
VLAYLLNPPPVLLPFQVNNNLMHSTHMIQLLLLHDPEFQGLSAKHALQVEQCWLEENEQWFDA